MKKFWWMYKLPGRCFKDPEGGTGGAGGEETPEQKEAREKQETEAKRQKENELKLQTLQEENAQLRKHIIESSGKKADNGSGFNWEAAEQRYGMTKDEIARSAVLFNDMIAPLKQENEKLKKMMDSGATKSQLDDAISSALGGDPAAPKYRSVMKDFLGDVPEELLSTEDGRKRWVTKAHDFAKSKLAANKPPKRQMNTESDDLPGGGDDDEPGGKGSGGYSAAEVEVMKEHGVDVDSYKKIQHPVIKDGIQIRSRFEKPKFA